MYEVGSSSLGTCNEADEKATQSKPKYFGSGEALPGGYPIYPEILSIWHFYSTLCLRGSLVLIT